MNEATLTDERTPAAEGPPPHGFRGDEPPPLSRPRGLTIAVSRETGARGTAAARKVGELLGWQVFDQELLDFLVNDEAARGQLLADVPAGAKEWAEARLERLGAEGQLLAEADTLPMVRLMLTIAARGEAVIVGRGAGFLLPSETTLHVRIVAPVEARAAYLAESLRLTPAEARAEIHARDGLRAHFLDRTFRRPPADVYGFDLVVNSARLGVEGSARVVAEAIRYKHLAAPAEPTDADPDRNG